MKTIHSPRLVTPIPQAKSSNFLPSPKVTYEPSPLVRTALTMRPRPAVTCCSPNFTNESCDWLDDDAMVRIACKSVCRAFIFICAEALCFASYEQRAKAAVERLLLGLEDGLSQNADLGGTP